MSYKLNGSPDELRDAFYLLARPEDIAEMLEVEYRSLNYWIYRTPEAKRYRRFSIPKRSGEPRWIDAPTNNVKTLQRKLNQVLQAVYDPKPSVHGFAPKRNVKTNAEKHVRKRWVLSVDLVDFFHAVNFGRVRGMFMGKPYNLHHNVATVLAHLCCFQRRLPQGAPTSPIVSNMICAQMDSELQQLARANHSTYSRYADDMTFSTTVRSFPLDLAFVNELGQVQTGQKLDETITRNGFEVNREKVRLNGRNRRQEVTGVTVNEFTNLPRKFTNQIRAMLHAGKKYGLCAAQDHWERKYDGKHRADWHNSPRFEKVLRGKIEYLGMIRGKEDITYLRFLDQLRELDHEFAGARSTPLRSLLLEYDQMSSLTSELQNRGYQLESLMTELFEIFGFAVEGSFTRNSGSEQIDGAFELDGLYYLVECKWQKKKVSHRETDSLLGKMRRSGADMGLFLSINGWSANAESALKQNPDKNIILVDGDDLRRVLTGEINLRHMLKSKRDMLKSRAEPFISVKDILSKRNDGKEAAT